VRQCERLSVGMAAGLVLPCRGRCVVAVQQSSEGRRRQSGQAGSSEVKSAKSEVRSRVSPPITSHPRNGGGGRQAGENPERRRGHEAWQWWWQSYMEEEANAVSRHEEAGEW